MATAQRGDDLTAMRRILANAQNKTVEFLKHMRKRSGERDGGGVDGESPLMYVTTPVMTNHYNYMHGVYRRMLSDSVGDVCDYTGGLVCTDLSSIARAVGSGGGKRPLKAVPLSVDLERVDQLDGVVAAAVRALDGMNFEAHDISMSVRDDYINNVNAIQAAYQNTLDETRRRADDAYRQLDEAKRVLAEALVARERDDREWTQKLESAHTDLSETRSRLAQADAVRNAYEERYDTMLREKNDELRRLAETMSTAAANRDGDGLLALIERLHVTVDQEAARVQHHIDSVRADQQAAVLRLQQRVDELEAERLAAAQRFATMVADYDRRAKESLNASQSALYDKTAELNDTRTELMRCRDHATSQQDVIGDLQRRLDEVTRHVGELERTKMMEAEAAEQRLAAAQRATEECDGAFAERNMVVAEYARQMAAAEKRLQECDQLELRALQLQEQLESSQHHLAQVQRETMAVRAELERTSHAREAAVAEIARTDVLLNDARRQLKERDVAIAASTMTTVNGKALDDGVVVEPTMTKKTTAMRRERPVCKNVETQTDENRGGATEAVACTTVDGDGDKEEDIQNIICNSFDRTELDKLLRRSAVDYVTRLEHDEESYGREPGASELIAHDVLTKDLDRLMATIWSAKQRPPDKTTSNGKKFLDHFLQTLGDAVSPSTIATKAGRNAVAIAVFNRYYIPVQNKEHYLRSVRGPFKGFTIVLGEFRTPSSNIADPESD